MPKFTYTARDRAGKSVAAVIEAPTRRDALRVLGSRGLQVASVAEVGGSSPKPAAAKAEQPDFVQTLTSSKRGNTPRRSECLPFLEALYDLLSSGLSAGEAVRLLSIRVKEPRLRALCAGLWEQISEGAALWRAMASYPDVFDPSITNLIQAGEATGSINDTVQRIIAHLTEQRELRRQLLSALAYPIFMVVVASGVILFFLFFLLPRLQSLLSSLGGKMPTSTTLLIGLADFVLNWGLIIIIAALFFAGSFWRWRKTDAGRSATDAWMLKLPLIGPFVVSQTVLAFSQTLSVLLENGITAAEALRMTERQIKNRVHREAFATATARVLEGESLSGALTRTNCFPDLVLDRLSVGENTGNVVPSLKQVAQTYQKAISRQLNAFTNVLASAVLLGVFVFVGFIAFAIVSAVFQVSASIKTR
ncbi:type II secretion system F family protein [Opitutus sp. ER46]|uniref:type II secretion system F family protein n=1 Tax=Opitutus sp. ER46 TaxID=2161864 RepID=UPI000D30DB1F|nr:type II secretion system F family protein [Opitutus sp. ER46]PTX91647.1 type II secretion system F family protein [Opitutus sp. ER46]